MKTEEIIKKALKTTQIITNDYGKAPIGNTYSEFEVLVFNAIIQLESAKKDTNETN